MSPHRVLPAAQLTEKEKNAVREYLARKGLPLDYSVTFADVGGPEIELEVGARDEYSEVLSRGHLEDFRAPLTPGFTLNLPILSANMRTVTGTEMAVAMAQEGGLGVVPQTMPLEKRLQIIRQVRRTDCALIEDPATIPDDKTLGEALVVMAKMGVKGLLVIDAHSKKLCGVLSHRDWLAWQDNPEMPVKKLMTTMPYAGWRGMTMEEAREFIRTSAHHHEKLPVVDDDFKVCGLFTARGLFYESHYPHALRDGTGKFHVAGSVGVRETADSAWLEEIQAQVDAGISILVMDTARGLALPVGEALDAAKTKFSDLPIVCGNTCSAAGAKFLFEHGADAVKVNQGSGHVCRTSAETPLGIGQLASIAECAAIAELYDKCISGDGGMKSALDIIKAIMAGAHTVMTGYLLVGTYESAAPAYRNKQGFLVKGYQGSASDEEQEERIKEGSLNRKRKAEGVREEVPLDATVAERAEEFRGSFRSTLSYLGYRTLGELRTESHFALKTVAAAYEGTKRAGNEKQGSQGPISRLRRAWEAFKT